MVDVSFDMCRSCWRILQHSMEVKVAGERVVAKLLPRYRASVVVLLTIPARINRAR